MAPERLWFWYCKKWDWKVCQTIDKNLLCTCTNDDTFEPSKHPPYGGNSKETETCAGMWVGSIAWQNKYQGTKEYHIEH